ncbi:MAG TPA: dephospho-CoA kinase [Polyangia bacterium]|nr:dephospho-CoA kinase [Polyangia bacterium]
MPRVIGLTGGIASGKSTVAALLRSLGAEIVDADLLAREIVAPGQPALAEIVGLFGPEVLAPDGTLDRKRLGARVFADNAARCRLNAITHPRIAAMSARRIQEAEARGHQVVIYEAALLVENGIHHAIDGVIVVAVAPEVQLTRLMAREHLDEAEARQRLTAQASLDAKLAVADYVIDNNGSPEVLRPQVEAVWRDVLAGGPKVRRRALRGKDLEPR